MALHFTCLQNQNPFVSFRDVWQSLPRCARVLLVWVLLEAVFIVIYATTVLITGTQQQFIFPLLVGACFSVARRCTAST